MDDSMDDAGTGWGAEPGWSGAAQGLRTCFHGLVAFCIFIGGAVLGMAVGVSMIAVRGPEGAADFTGFVQIYTSLGWIVVLAFMAAGIARWRGLPEMTGARGLAAQSLWWTLGYLVLTVVSFAIAVPKLGDMVAMAEVSTLTTILGVVANVGLAIAIATFQGSLVRAAANVGRLDIAAIARRALTVSLIVMGMSLFIYLIALGLPKSGDLMAGRGSLALIGLVGLGAAGLGIWALVDVMRAVAKLRAAILHEISIVGQF